VGADRTVRVWNLAGNSGRADLLFTFRGHRDKVEGLNFHPSGKELATVSADGEVKVWDVTHDAEFRALPASGGVVRSVAFSPDSRLLASATEGQWVETGEPKQQRPKRWEPAEVRVCDAGTGRPVARWRLPGVGVSALAFSPDGKRLATGTT